MTGAVERSQVPADRGSATARNHERPRRREQDFVAQLPGKL
jgi:hypothetical protein